MRKLARSNPICVHPTAATLVRRSNSYETPPSLRNSYSGLYLQQTIKLISYLRIYLLCNMKFQFAYGLNKYLTISPSTADLRLCVAQRDTCVTHVTIRQRQAWTNRDGYRKLGIRCIVILPWVRARDLRFTWAGFYFFDLRLKVERSIPVLSNRWFGWQSLFLYFWLWEAQIGSDQQKYIFHRTVLPEPVFTGLEALRPWGGDFFLLILAGSSSTHRDLLPIATCTLLPTGTPPMPFLCSLVTHSESFHNLSLLLSWLSFYLYCIPTLLGSFLRCLRILLPLFLSRLRNNTVKISASQKESLTRTDPTLYDELRASGHVASNT